MSAVLEERGARHLEQLLGVDRARVDQSVPRPLDRPRHAHGPLIHDRPRDHAGVPPPAGAAPQQPEQRPGR